MGSLLYSSQTHLRRHADLAGVTASGVCLIHCLLTPFLVSLAPDLLPYLPGDVWFHRALAVGIILVGAVAFFPGYLLHRGARTVCHRRSTCQGLHNRHAEPFVERRH